MIRYGLLIYLSIYARLYLHLIVLPISIYIYSTQLLSFSIVVEHFPLLGFAADCPILIGSKEFPAIREVLIDLLSLNQLHHHVMLDLGL